LNRRFELRTKEKTQKVSQVCLIRFFALTVFIQKSVAPTGSEMFKKWSYTRFFLFTIRQTNGMMFFAVVFTAFAHLPLTPEI
jgi:hypothetical protein